MDSLLIGVGVAAGITGYMVGRFTAPKERTTVTMMSNLPPANDPVANAEIETLIRAGHTIDAIKLYRTTYGVDLTGAKQGVDLMRERLTWP